MAVDRWHAEQGQTVRLRAQFKNSSGNLYDPHSVDEVEIRKADGTLVTTILAAAIVHEALGIYYADWAIPALQDVGSYVDTWAWTPSAGAAQCSGPLTFVIFLAGSFSAAGVYIDVATVKSDYLKPASEWPAGTYPSDTDIQAAIVLASEIIDFGCKRSFLPEDTSLTLDGSGRPYQKIERHGHVYKAISIDSITIDGTALDMDDVVVYPFFVVDKYWDKNDLRGSFCVDYTCGSICGSSLSSCGVCFTKGRDNVVMTGRFGDYSSCPETIKMCCGKLAARGLEEEWGYFTPLYSETLGDWSYTMREIAKNAAATGKTGWSDIDAMIRRYSKKRVVIGRI